LRHSWFLQQLDVPGSDSLLFHAFSPARAPLRSDADERVFGAPSITIRRGMLAEILLAQPRATGVDARFNVRMTGVAASSDRVRLALSDGLS
jgi:hypothetical protein